MNTQKYRLKLKSRVGQAARPTVGPLPACAGSLARARGILFSLRTLQPIRFRDGPLHVPAGAAGCAVLAWRGDRPGWVCEFGGHGVAGLKAAQEGEQWVRVASEKSS